MPPLNSKNPSQNFVFKNQKFLIRILTIVFHVVSFVCTEKYYYSFLDLSSAYTTETLVIRFPVCIITYLSYAYTVYLFYVYVTSTSMYISSTYLFHVRVNLFYICRPCISFPYHPLTNSTQIWNLSTCFTLLPSVKQTLAFTVFILPDMEPFHLLHNTSLS